MRTILKSDVERATFKEAFKLSMATMPGMCAWGVVTGMAMVKSGLTIDQAMGMTFLVYAGASQLAALPLIAGGAPLWMVFVTAIVVNLRFVIFAASIGPHFAHLRWYQRLWYGYFNIDITMGYFQPRYPDETRNQTSGKLGFFGGIGYPNWVVWQVGSVAGILLGSQIPQTWGIGFAGTLALFALLIPMINNRAVLAAVVVAASIAVVGAQWPYRLSLLVALIAGMVVAMAIETLTEKSAAAEPPK